MRSLRPRACSGGMYSGVPITMPVRVFAAVTERLEHPRDPEVEHLHGALAREEHVVWLQVAVHHVLRVRRREHVENAFRDDEHFFLLELPALRIRCASDLPLKSSITR